MLNIENLQAGYGKVEVLHGVTIKVPKGKIVTLIGSNGAGKTTTMRAISGMIKPVSGTVTLAGEDITGLQSHLIAKRGLAHSPEGRRVFPTLSVLDNIRLGAFVRYTNVRPKGDGDVSAPERADQSTGGHFVRRRAANAGHGARRHAQPRGFFAR